MDEDRAVFAAATRTHIAATFALIVGFLLVGQAGGAPPTNRDRVAPSPPPNVHVIRATDTLVSVAWDASQDDVGVLGYYVYGDSGRARVSSPAYTVTSLACGESSVVSVVAFDAAGNRSARSTAAISTAPCRDVTSPSRPTGFRQQATTQDTVVLAWTPSTDDVGTVSYGVYRGFVRESSVREPSIALSGLACGRSYAYSVDAADAAGNRSMPGWVLVQTAPCGGDAAPSAPSDLVVTARTATSLSLTWTPSTDDVAVTGYRISIDGRATGTVVHPATTLTPLDCGKAYTITVDAYDAAGHRSPPASIAASTSACPPTSPPPTDAIPPTTPSNLTVSNVTQNSVALTWAPSTDNVGVTEYDVYRGSAKVATTKSTFIDQTGLSCGTTYSFGIAARDAASNSSTQARVNASTAPCVVAPPPPPSADTTPPSQPGSLAMTGATETTVSLTWSPSVDNVGVVGYRAYVAGALAASPTQPTATVGGLTCGTAYRFEVEAVDAAGNRSTRASVLASTSACPDTQPPSAPTGVVATSRTTTSIALLWSASTDNVGVVTYGLYRGGTRVATTSSTTAVFTGLACNTNYTLGVDARDAAGNHSSQTTVLVSTTACPDTTPPSTPSRLTASNVSSSALTLTWTPASDNVGVAAYDVFRDGAKVASVTGSSSSQAGLACGTSYRFGVLARDAAGNASPQAQVTVSTAACPPPTSSWTFCANEDQQCSFSDTRDVRYGANGVFTQPRTITGGVLCANTVFGDPLVGVKKYCEMRPSTSTTSPPPAPAPPPPSPTPPPTNVAPLPATITSGGTYAGSRTGTVQVRTAEPVVIQDSSFQDGGSATLLDLNFPGAQVTVRNSRFKGGSGRAIYAYGYKSLRVENCEFEKTWGIRADSVQAGGSVTVVRNRARNINGSSSFPHFFQAANASNTVPMEIAWNEVISTQGQTNVSDVINIYNASGARIHDNYVEGSFDPAGSGIMLDSNAHDNEVYDNVVVGIANTGIGIASGWNNKVYNNRAISSGQDATSNAVGIYVWNYDGNANWRDNAAWSNVVGWKKSGGTRNDWWLPNCSGNCTNSALPNPIDESSEQAAYQSWLARVSSSSVRLGSSG